MKKTIISIFVIGLMMAACQNPTGGGGSPSGVPSNSTPSDSTPSDNSPSDSMPSGATDTKLNGTWIGTVNGDQGGYKFNNGNFEGLAIENGRQIPGLKGTYSTSSGKIILTYTLIYLFTGNTFNLAPNWYSKTDLEKFNIDMGIWEPATVDYTINGNKLTLTNKAGESLIFTKQ